MVMSPEVLLVEQLAPLLMVAYETLLDVYTTNQTSLNAYLIKICMCL